VSSCGRKFHCHSTTSGSSHLSKGVFLGVSERDRNQKPNEFPCFVSVFESVPGSQINGLRAFSFVHQGIEKSKHPVSKPPFLTAVRIPPDLRPISSPHATPPTSTFGELISNFHDPLTMLGRFDTRSVVARSIRGSTLRWIAITTCGQNPSPYRAGRRPYSARPQCQTRCPRSSLSSTTQS